MNNMRKQIGISLVEILVALVISLFLLGGIVQVYTGNKATFSFTNALAEVQENGRFALDYMSQDLRLAHNWACIQFDPNDTENINNTLDATTVTDYNVLFHDFVNQPSITGTENTGGLGTSDTITIRGGKPGQTNVEPPFETAGTNKLRVNVSDTIGADDFVLVARCGPNDLLIPEEADLLQIATATPMAGNTQTEFTFTGNKSQQYENDATVVELQTVTYSIAAAAVGGEPTLVRSEFGEDQELIEGVEDMQILYGVDDGYSGTIDSGDGFANQYLPADKVGNFDAVVSIRISLLVRSFDRFVTDDPQTYTFNGVQTTPADRRIRQVFSATIALRNRIGSS